MRQVCTKVYIIEENFMAIKSLLSNNPTEDDIELAVSAMEFNPLNDLISDLEKGAVIIKNAALKKRCSEVLALMKSKGHPVNQKSLLPK